MNKSLNELRNEINTIDEELVQILAKRLEIVREIGKIKKEINVDPLDEKRWQEVLKQVFETAKKHAISQDLVKKIYEVIHKTALEIEKDK
jgi:chorismate mutase